MEAAQAQVFRTELNDRRDRLQAAIAEAEETSHLARLLADVDLALKRLGNGSFGLCETCHDPIEEDRLRADPLIRFCIDHLTAEEQRALEQDLNLASRVQEHLLPQRQVRFGGWDISYHFEPARVVSGDYCDLLTSDTDEGLFLSLGDISGKGVAASMLMAHLHATFRSLIPADLPLNRLVERANRLFGESTLSSHYATLVCGRARSSGTIELCNAGHPPPLLVRGGAVTRIKATGLPLGLFGTVEHATTEVKLSRGDSLVLYTDGISEARDETGEEYGVDRLARLVGDSHALPPAEMIAALRNDLTAFRSKAPVTDDVTIMSIRRVG